MIDNWEQYARCAREEKPTEFFFPLTDDEPDQLREQRAADYCGECFVRRECLAATIEGERHEPNSVVVFLGVAGGRTAAQRVEDRKVAKRKKSA